MLTKLAFSHNIISDLTFNYHQHRNTERITSIQVAGLLSLTVMLRSASSDDFHMLIRTRNSRCTVAWFEGEYDKGTYRFPEGVVEWAPSKTKEVINVDIILKEAGKLTVVRSTDPEKPNTAVIENRCISIEYQGRLDDANLYIDGNRIRMGHFPKLRKTLVKY
jgi:hypothetical protein